MWARLDRDISWESKDVKLLGITLDSNLFHLRKDAFSLKLLLSRSLNIVHSCGCFMEGKLMIR